MPRVNVYIRVSDWQKWQHIEDKPEWLHMALEGTDVPKVNRAIEERKKIADIMKPMVALFKRRSQREAE